MRGERLIPWDQRLARILVRPLAGTRVRPNHLTTLSLLFGVVAAVLFSFGEPVADGWAALLFMLAVFADHTDGELARLTGRKTGFGHVYDFLVGAINYTALFIGMGIGQSAGGFGAWALFLGFAAGLANPVIVTLRLRMERRFGPESVRHPAAYGFEIEDFVYLIGPFTWAGGLVVFFVAYGLGTLGYLAWTSWEYTHSGRREGLQ